jgi:hypothetical protein
MSRDQKPGKVRHVGTAQDRRQGDVSAQPAAVAGAPVTGVAATAGAGEADAAMPATKGGIGLIAILMFLVCAGAGGGGIVALAPTLGLWP